MSKDVMEFLVYIIHACANAWNQTPTVVYKMLVANNCISGYLIPNYEILHTQGTSFIVQDVAEYVGLTGDRT
ncbi:MAG: DUF3791 domain-containing protein [Lachnospiraceae bacterium]|nr:DUF3791 domain-containing protein [Lachnospiraceae bacterium]